MKLSPIFVGFTILAAAGHAQIIPGSTGHGAPTFNCAANDYYKDADSGLVWQCKTPPTGWAPTPQFVPWQTPTNGQCLVGNGNTFTTGSCGAGSGILPSQLALVTAESFGAVGDGTWAGSGTDNTTALQNAINSLQNAGICGQVLLQDKVYKITSALSITHSCVGIQGVAAGGTVGSAVTTPLPSGIVSTSATADIIDVLGTDANHRLLYNRFENFALGRSTAPTSATAKGLSVNYVAGAIINYVQSMDSGEDFYFHSAPAFGIGHISHTWASWGYNGVTEAAGVQLSGYYLDSADGNAENSIIIDNGAATSPLATSVIVHGMDIVGTSINDVDTYLFGTANMTIGVYVNYTGTGTIGTGSDIQFINVTNDAFSKTGFSINSVPGLNEATVNIVGGYDVSTTATTDACVTINASSGVNVSGHQILCPANNAGLFAVNSTNLTLNGNNITNNQTGSAVFLSGVTNSTLSGNVITNPTTNASTLINLQSTSKNNSITGNALSGFASVGLAFDASSINNNQVGNTIDPTHITTPISDASGTNSPSVPGMVKISEQVLGGTTASVTFSSIPQTYRNLRLVINGRTDNTNPNVGIQFNGDTGANYDTEIMQATGTTATGFAASAATSTLLGNLAISTAPAGAPGSLDTMIYNYAGTTFWKITTATNGYEQAASTLYSLANSGMWHSTAAITSIRLAPGTGNFVAGSSFTLYGMN